MSADNTSRLPAPAKICCQKRRRSVLWLVWAFLILSLGSGTGLYADERIQVVERRGRNECAKTTLISQVISDSLRARSIPFKASVMCMISRDAGRFQRSTSLYDTVLCDNVFLESIKTETPPDARILVLSASDMVLFTMSLEDYLAGGWTGLAKKLGEIGQPKRGE